jgi:polysaccharide export outer membrane protein
MSFIARKLDGDRRPSPRRSIAAAVVAILVSIGLSATGCSDPRISILEFIEMQQQQTPPPTTQPSDRTADVWAKHAFVPDLIGPSDILSVALTGLDGPTETTALQVRVNRQGEISVPMVGAVKVGDMELEDAERAIQQRYVPSIVKVLSVNVEVVRYDTTDVLVVGAVATPGLIPLRRTQRDLLHVVAKAGGVSFEASGRINLQRVRRPNEEVTLNVLDPVELEAAFALPPLEAGDIVAVEAATPNTIFVGGLVNAPGPQAYLPGTTVNLLQVLAAAGGVRTDVAPTEATLIHRMPDGKDVQVKIELGRLQRGEDPNIMLAAGDILWVPETFGTKTLDFINRNLFFRAGVSVTAGYNAQGIDFLNRRELQKGRFGVGGAQTLQDQFDPFGFFTP